MAFVSIDIGSAPNDGTGDPLRDAFGKVNANFIDAQGQLDAQQAVDIGLSGSITSVANSVTALNAKMVGLMTVGSWTPTLGGVGGNPTVSSYSQQTGRWFRIANMMTVWFDIGWVGKSGGSGTLLIAGMPTTAASGAGTSFAGAVYLMTGMTIGSDRQVGLGALAGNSQIRFQEFSGTTNRALTVADAAATGRCIGSLSYLVNLTQVT